MISRFGNIVTGRVYRKSIESIWASPEVASMKAARLLQYDVIDEPYDENVFGEPDQSLQVSPTTGVQA